MDDGLSLSAFEPVITLFLAGRPRSPDHARHIAIANLLRELPHGRELMHLGLQVTCLRKGVPEKYDRALAPPLWEEVKAPRPALDDFADVLAGATGR